MGSAVDGDLPAGDGAFAGVGVGVCLGDLGEVPHQFQISDLALIVADIIGVVVDDKVDGVVLSSDLKFSDNEGLLADIRRSVEAEVGHSDIDEQRIDLAVTLVADEVLTKLGEEQVGELLVLLVDLDTLRAGHFAGGNRLVVLFAVIEIEADNRIIDHGFFHNAVEVVVLILDKVFAVVVSVTEHQTGHLVEDAQHHAAFHILTVDRTGDGQAVVTVTEPGAAGDGDLPAGVGDLGEVCEGSKAAASNGGDRCALAHEEVDGLTELGQRKTGKIGLLADLRLTVKAEVGQDGADDERVRLTVGYIADGAITKLLDHDVNKISLIVILGADAAEGQFLQRNFHAIRILLGNIEELYNRVGSRRSFPLADQLAREIKLAVFVPVRFAEHQTGLHRFFRQRGGHQTDDQKHRK